jgi:hypothetical protein
MAAMTGVATTTAGMGTDTTIAVGIAADIGKSEAARRG